MSPLPDVSAALWGLTDDLTLRRVSKSVSGGVVTENIGKSGLQKEQFDGVIQPMPARRVAMKPEGERTWKWWTLWTDRGDLGLDDWVTDQAGNNFRVMSLADWTSGGYAEYELTQDFDRVVT